MAKAFYLVLKLLFLRFRKIDSYLNQMLCVGRSWRGAGCVQGGASPCHAQPCRCGWHLSHQRRSPTPGLHEEVLSLGLSCVSFIIRSTCTCPLHSEGPRPSAQRGLRTSFCVFLIIRAASTPFFLFHSLLLLLLHCSSVQGERGVKNCFQSGESVGSAWKLPPG